MNRKINVGLIAVGCVTLAAFLLLMAQAQRIDRAQAELKALRAKVERLERDTTAFQSKSSNDREHPRTLITLPGETLMAPSSLPLAPGTKIPPGWKPFEFNGLTYYLTPLKN
jgi:outer membrane murein-binding lipoprotein Lpp